MQVLPKSKYNLRMSIGYLQPLVYVSIIDADKSGLMSEFVRIAIHFTFLNACISVKTSPINTKLGDFVSLGVLFLTMWINSC